MLFPLAGPEYKPVVPQRDNLSTAWFCKPSSYAAAQISCRNVAVISPQRNLFTKRVAREDLGSCCWPLAKAPWSPSKPWKLSFAFLFLPMATCRNQKPKSCKLCSCIQGHVHVPTSNVGNASLRPGTRVSVCGSVDEFIFEFIECGSTSLLNSCASPQKIAHVMSALNQARWISSFLQRNKMNYLWVKHLCACWTTSSDTLCQTWQNTHPKPCWHDLIRRVFLPRLKGICSQ